VSASIEDVLRDHTPGLMAIPGVVGTAQGARDDGSACVLVLVESRTAEIAASVPETLAGFPVEVRVTGELEARPETD